MQSSDTKTNTHRVLSFFNCLSTFILWNAIWCQGRSVWEYFFFFFYFVTVQMETTKISIRNFNLFVCLSLCVRSNSVTFKTLRTFLIVISKYLYFLSFLHYLHASKFFLMWLARFLFPFLHCVHAPAPLLMWHTFLPFFSSLYIRFHVRHRGYQIWAGSNHRKLW